MLKIAQTFLDLFKIKNRIINRKDKQKELFYFGEKKKHNIRVLADFYGTPTLFLSIAEVTRAYRRLSVALPNVKLYYALKSNNHDSLVRHLNGLGACFDVCSNAEIDTILRNNISIRKCIHTHPVKTEKMISYAYEKGIRTFVVDNIDEIRKLRKYAGKIRLLFRLAIRNSQSLADLSKKFGSYSKYEILNLIELAKAYGFSSFGLCFHTGSQGHNPNSFRKALKKCIWLIKYLENKDIAISVVDIGGGFPISYRSEETDINHYCSVFYPLIKKITDKGIEVIAEPGRFISGNSMFLVTKVLGYAKRKNRHWYYLDDSIYNSFSGQIFDHAKYPFYTLNRKKGKKLPSVISGATCDSYDIIDEEAKVRKLDLNEILVYEKMGAYTSVSASEFNGFSKTKIIVID